MRGRLQSASLFFLLVLGSACGGPPPAPAANAQQEDVIWSTLRTWSGSGDEQLDSFTSDTGALRIAWEAKRVADAAGPGSLKIVVHSAISGRPLAAAVVDHQGEGKGTAYVSEEPRVFFAEVSSQDVEWTVTISERLR
ncbi:MAG: hypothetical protein EXQ55_05040 [Acidobacteria bacterium]|nr:hypothetical protein [Acidobacteriota bacterium]